MTDIDASPAPRPNKIVILGASHGGVQAATSLRDEGFEGALHLIGEEPGLPYQRPPLSKTYLKEADADRLRFRTAEFYARQEIDYRAGVRAEAIDRAAREVALADGSRLAYDHLILAVGARNRRLPIAGADLPGVCEIRTLADADAMRARLETARRIVVIGGGFIGLETAAAVRAMGREAIVLEAADRLLARSSSPEISDFLLTAHRALGVEIEFGALATEILEKDGAAAGVALRDVRRVEGDLVLVCVGVVPNQELAAAAGLAVEDGVVIDAGLSTSDPAISAIGDCARFPHRAEGAMLRLESVQNAVDQAKNLAKRLTKGAPAYDEVAWFWSDQGPYKLQIAGLIAGADHRVALAAEDGAKLTVLSFRDGALLGSETVNAPADHMMTRRLLAKTEPTRFDALEAAGFALRAFR